MRRVTQSQEGLWVFGYLVPAPAELFVPGVRMDVFGTEMEWASVRVGAVSTCFRTDDRRVHVSTPTPCLKEGQLWGQTRHLRTIPSLVLKLSQDGGRLHRPGNLLRYLHGEEVTLHIQAEPWTLNLSPFILESFIAPSSTVKGLQPFSWKPP